MGAKTLFGVSTAPAISDDKSAELCCHLPLSGEGIAWTAVAWGCKTQCRLPQASPHSRLHPSFLRAVWEIRLHPVVCIAPDHCWAISRCGLAPFCFAMWSSSLKVPIWSPYWLSGQVNMPGLFCCSLTRKSRWKVILFLHIKSKSQWFLNSSGF